jgi:peptide/nickel transport system permease protein
MSVYNPQAVITPVDYELGTLFDVRPDGTGAFILDSYDVAVSAKYVANADWWGGVPYLDGVEVLFSDDNATQINGLLGDQADAVIQFAVSDADALFNDDNVTVESTQSAGHRQIWFNVREGTFSGENGKKIREAVALGIDRNALVEQVLQGRGDVGNDHPIAPVYEFHDAGLAQRERDIEAAMALLEEAGAAGLSITMHAPDLQEIALLAEVVQSQLKDIGMDITLNVESTATFYDRWCAVYDSPTEPAGCDGGEEFGIVDYGNRGTPDRYLVAAYATGEWNSAHYANEEFNEAVRSYQAAVELDARKEAIKPVQQIAHDDIPYVIPYFYDLLTAYKSNHGGGLLRAPPPRRGRRRRLMGRFLLKRLGSMVITLWMLATIVFLLVNVLPGDVGRKVLGPTARAEDVARLNETLGTDKPLFQQYLTSMKNLVTLNFGDSYQFGTPVTDLVIPALGRSAKLALLAFVITIPISIAAGIFAARRQDKLADRIVVNAGLGSSSIPEFVTASVLLAVFAVQLGYGKVYANVPEGTSFFGQLEYLLLPALAMVISYFGYIARMSRAGVITALQSDYVRTATMKGLTSGQVMRRHVLRNAMAPTITVISVQIGYLFGGIIGVEKVFNYAGLGSTMLNAVGKKDIPVLSASVLIVGIIYMVSTLLADLLIALLNPRIRLDAD